jgi:putative phage-type endonuclease
LQQNTKEWLDYRKGKIGSSDAPSIMGVGFKTPYQLWLEKLSLSETPINKSMQRGHDLEEEARRAFENITDLLVFPEVIESKEHNWMIASLDGITLKRDAIVEIKCAGQKDHDIALNGQIPDKYFPQVQHQMAVSELDFCYYFSYHPNKYALLKINRDQPYIDKLIEKEKVFFDCIINFYPPKILSKDYQERADKEWQEASIKYLEAKKNSDYWQDQEKALRDQVLSLSNGVNSQGNGLRLTKVIRKGVIDYSSIPQIQEVNLEDYRKSSIESWRISTYD